MMFVMLLSIHPVWGERGGFQPITSTNGLSDLVVNSILKDSRGFVWFGTGLGLDRFDGNNIRSYPIPGEDLNAKRVNTIVEGPRHEIYIGNASGLYVLNPGSAEMEPLHHDKINMSVNSLAVRSDTLFVATDAGLFSLDLNHRKLSRFLPDPDVMSGANAITAMHVTPADEVWFATSRGLNRYSPAGKQLKTYPREGVFDATSIFAMGDTLFIGTNGGGITSFRRSTERYLPRVSIGNDIITDLTAFNGNLVIATDGSGVYVYDPVGGRIVRHYYAGGAENLRLRSNSVYSVMADGDGLLWVGYYQDGADYTLHTKPIFDVYKSENGKFTTQGRAVRAVAVDGRQKLIGTREGLIYVNDLTGEVREFKSPQIRSNIIFCIQKWREKYYIGTYNGGMYVFDPATKKLTEFRLSSTADSRESVFALAEDADGCLWIGSSEGVYVLDASGSGQITRTFNRHNSHLPGGNVYEIFFDSTGRGWICTETGMAVYDGTTLRSDGFPQGFINRQKIRDVNEDKAGNLYFLPDRGDIYRSNLELTEFGPLTGISAATNRTATFICNDKDGLLWIGSEMGLVRFDGKETLRYFSLSDGLPSKVFTFCSPVIDENDDLWFGNSRGLVHLAFDNLRNGASMKRLPEVTEIASNGISVYNRLHRGRNLYSIELENEERNLAFSHANFDFIAPDDQIVEYMLEGYDEHWNMKSGIGQISYFNLPSGHYRFRIRQAGDPTSETGYEIVIRPWVNKLAVLLTLLILVVVGVAVYYYVLHRRHRQEASMLQQRESEREEEADRKAREEELRRYKTTRLSDEECKRLYRKLESLMKAERPYTNANLKSADLAAMIGTTTHALSFLFNQYLHKNYYDYVNEYRVSEFKRLVGELDTSRYTLTAMSQMCGFSSRASFFRHFKNLTGITPADYMKSVKK